MKTKLLITLALIAVLGIVVIGCGGNDNNEGNKNLTGTITISPNANVIINTLLTANYNGSEAVNYQWNKDDTAISNMTGTTYTPTDVGIYTVTVSASGYNSITSAPVNVEDIYLTFENFTNPSVLMTNTTGERLVMFKNTIAQNTLISGIPAYAEAHGLYKDANLFNASGIFTIIIVTESQFNNNKNNLTSLNNQAFGKLFAFYNHTTTNKKQIIINDKLGGDYRLTVNNSVNKNIELRNFQPMGDCLVYLPAQTPSRTVVFLNSPETYDIYPVYRIYNTADNEIYTAIPVYKSGVSQNKAFSYNVTFTTEETDKTIILSDFSSTDYLFLSGGIYLKIINNSAIDISLFRREEIQTTSLGIDTVKSNNTETFFLSFTRNPDRTLPVTFTFNNTPLSIGTTQEKTAIESQTYEMDFCYEIEITGNSATNLQLGTVTKKSKVNIEQIFGIN